ncbi:LysR family transcriptional regulator [Nibrella viscosa]|uniref:LysR family transcriptional regulator n=1 Tax=Nibrella viscosa TaxID=1084524 RepID=A0ABP8KEE5_9BACT
MKLRLNGRIWLEGDERFMGIGRMELLEHIQQTGSINQAAKAMKMSYKRAWELVHSMNEQSPQPLVITQTGGERGGGALVTPEGEQYLQYYRQLQARFQEFLQQESAAIPF